MIHSTLNNEDATILIWKMTESETELISRLTNFDSYKSEFFKLKTEKRKKEFLVPRIALNMLAKKELVIAYTPQGKPLVFGNSLNISISHSGQWVAVIFHPTKTVGIDLEVPTDKFQKLYQRFLNKKEQELLFDPYDLRKVQLAWSAKETLYKIIGIEAVNFDKQLEIKPFELSSEGTFTGLHIASGKTFLLNYSVNEEFNLVYCIDN